MPYPILAPNSTWYKSASARSTITEINIVNSYTATGSENETWNADANNSGSIKCYRTGTVLTIAGNGTGKIYANPDSSFTFSDIAKNDHFNNVTTLNGAALLDTSNVTNMEQMFRNTTKLITVDVGNWNTSNVTSMRGMFMGSSGNIMAWQNLDVATKTVGSGESAYTAWYTGNVTDMTAMFQYCLNLTILDVSNWDVSAVTLMRNLFYECSSLTSLDVSKWDTSNVTEMRFMFNNCTSLESLDVSNWNTSKVTTFASMFSGNDYAGDMKIRNLNVSNWDTSSATVMNHMFYGCGQLTELDLSKWNVSNVTNMNHMFADCFKLNSLNISNWDTSNVEYFYAMFNDCSSLVTLDVSDLDTSNCISFAQMFENCSKLTNIIGLENFDLSSTGVQESYDLFEMFKGCSSLKQLNLSGFDTSKSWCLSYMFKGCSSLETIYVSDLWDISNITESIETFEGCTNLVGGAGTLFDPNVIDVTYAKIDGGPDNPGYLTNINDETRVSIQTGTLHKLGVSMRQITGEQTKYYPSNMIDNLKTMHTKLREQSALINKTLSILDGDEDLSASMSQTNILDRNTANLTTILGIVDDSPKGNLLYKLPQETVFDGVDDYIDTGVKLFDEPKSFTIICDAAWPTNSSTRGIYQAFQNDSGGAWQAAGVTMLARVDTDEYYLTAVNKDGATTVLKWIASNIIKNALVVTDGIPTALYYITEEGGEVQTFNIPNCGYFAHTYPLKIGCNAGWWGSNAAYAAMTVHNFEVWDYAMTAGEAAEVLNPTKKEESIVLPELTNPGVSEELFSGKELIDGEGNVVIGSFTIDEELNTQDDLIAQIRATVDSLPDAGGGGNAYMEFHPYYMVFLNNSIPTTAQAELLSISRNNDTITITYNGTGHKFFGIDTLYTWDSSSFKTSLVEGIDYDYVDDDGMSYVVIQLYISNPFAIFCVVD